jgi:predicted ABC-type ATPase
MLNFKNFLHLDEGVHDKGIFHAVFMAGSPGSGKDYVMHKSLAGHGLREINSDVAFEHAMKKHGLNPKMPESEQPQRDVLRAKAKHTTELKKTLSEKGRNGVIINGTGDDPEKIKTIKGHLESLGYKTHMIYVHVPNETSRERNVLRGKLGGREIPEDVRQEKWAGVHKSKSAYKDMFGSHFHAVDNSIDMTSASKDERLAHTTRLNNLHKHFGKEISSKEHTPEAQKWIDSQLKRA